MPKAKKPAKPKRKAKKARPGAPESIGASPAPCPEPVAPPTPYAEFKPPADFTFWNADDHDELAEAWLALNERHQAFFREWYTNGFHATNAYVKVYDQQNRDAAGVNASQLLGSTNFLRLRRAIWKVQSPPLERMAAVEREVLEAPEDTDPKTMRIKLMKLGAVQSMREYHRVLPNPLPGAAPAAKAPTVKGTFELDVTDIKDLLNGGG